MAIRRSSIQVDSEFKKALEMLKKYRRESYQDVLERKMKRDLENVKKKLKLKKIM